MLHRSIHLLKDLNRIIAVFVGIQTRSATYMPKPVTVIHSSVTNAVHQVMDAIDAPVYLETYDIMGNMNHFPQEFVDSIRKNKVCLYGSFMTSLCTGVRKELHLFASIVNCFNLNDQPSRDKNINIVVIRESTEGEYAGREHEVVPGVIEIWSDRIAKYAFEYAQLNKRKKVTTVYNNGKDKRLTDAFFLECCQEVANMYPNITYNEIGIGKCCLQLVEIPERFDVIVTPNLYGIFIANVASMMMPGGSFGAKYAIFQQVESVGNQINPVALLFSTVMMLRHLLLISFADRLETANSVMSQEKCSSNTSTEEVLDAVLANLV